MFDVFVARLQCPECDRSVDAEAQTHIRNGLADSSALGVGFQFESAIVTHEGILDAGYALVEPPGPSGPIRLLDVWICRGCDTEQWAVVEIADRQIRSIQVATLDRATLDSVNYISEVNADLLARAFARGEPETEEPSVEILRRRLP